MLMLAGLRNYKMTKTGLTSFFYLKRGFFMTYVLCFHVLKGPELFLFRNYAKILIPWIGRILKEKVSSRNKNTVKANSNRSI